MNNNIVMISILLNFIRYGKDGVSATGGYDCAMIPGGVTTNNGNIEEFCGGKLDKQITSMFLYKRNQEIMSTHLSFLCSFNITVYDYV